MTKTTRHGSHSYAGENESFEANVLAPREVETEVQAMVRFPKLPESVVRERGQKICSYCKHTIDEDPYFPYETFGRRVLQNKTYVLRYGVLELVQWAANMFYFLPNFRAYLLNVKQRILLPGWVRCANPDCGQLYHASCWYQLKNTKGCLRCHAEVAQRVV